MLQTTTGCNYVATGNGLVIYVKLSKYIIYKSMELSEITGIIRSGVTDITINT